MAGREAEPERDRLVRLVVELLNTVVFYAHTWHRAQQALERAPRLKDPPKDYRRWWEHERGPALHGYVPPEGARCPYCGREDTILYVSARREPDGSRLRLCDGCYLEVLGRGPTASWVVLLDRLTRRRPDPG